MCDKVSFIFGVGVCEAGIEPAGIVLAGDVTGDVFAEAREHPPWAAPTVAALAGGVNVDLAVALDHDLVMVGVLEEVFADLLICGCHGSVVWCGVG